MVMLSIVRARDVTEHVPPPREDNVSMGPGQPEALGVRLGAHTSPGPAMQ